MCSHLETFLIEAIKADGPMSFETFMRHALYHPRWGYYAMPQQVGKRGDFCTSISVSPLYGSLWALQFEELWQKMGQCAGFCIIEQGAHDGQFASDVLTFSRQHLPDFFAGSVYYLIEPNPLFREVQQARLHTAGFAQNTRWVESVDELRGWRGVFFSNELVDSFPAHRMIFKKGEWFQDFVTRNSAGWKPEEPIFRQLFKWVHRKLKDEKLMDICSKLPYFPTDPFIFELSLVARFWMKQLCETIQEGVIITGDYGFSSWLDRLQSHPSGTLRAYKDHTVSKDVLSHPGENDITYHVDFEPLIEEAVQHGVQTICLDDQHHILTGLMHAFVQKIGPPDSKTAQSFQTLSHPSTMGTSFKYLIQGKGMPSLLSLHSLRYARLLDQKHLPVTLRKKLHDQQL